MKRCLLKIKFIAFSGPETSWLRQSPAASNPPLRVLERFGRCHQIYFTVIGVTDIHEKIIGLTHPRHCFFVMFVRGVRIE